MCQPAACGFRRRLAFLLLQERFSCGPDACQNFCDGQTHEDSGEEVLYIRSAGCFGHGTAGDAEEDKNKPIEGALLTLQLLCAAQQAEDLLIVLDAHAVLRRILAVHQLRKRHMKRFAEPLNDAVIGHTRSVLPF